MELFVRPTAQYDIRGGVGRRVRTEKKFKEEKKDVELTDDTSTS